MKTLLLDGVEYVKASEAAKAHGYTSDYIGQLCRGGKIDAKLVGRSWYVNIETLQVHRKNRYRSSQKKTKQAIEKVKQAKPKEAPHFYTRVPKEHIAYEPDEHEVMPTVRKLQLEPDEPVIEHELAVTEATEEPSEFYLEAEMHRKPTHGRLTITNEETAGTEDTAEREPETAEAEVAVDKAKQVKAEETTDPAPITRIHDALLPKQKLKKTLPAQPKVTETVPTVKAKTIATNTPPQPETGSLSPVPSPYTPVLISLVVGLVVASVLMGVNWHYEVGEYGDNGGYRFNLSAVISSEI